MSKEIGYKIKTLRKNKKLSQEEMSIKAKISRSTLSNYETGRRTPHIKELTRIAGFFGVGLDYFGLTPQNEAFDVLSRAKDLFENPNVARETKEQLFDELMGIYMKMKKEAMHSDIYTNSNKIFTDIFQNE